MACSGILFGVGYERYADGTLRWNDLNWMKTGFYMPDDVTTVSPSYAHEIMTPSSVAVDQILRMESVKSNYCQWNRYRYL